MDQLISLADLKSYVSLLEIRFLFNGSKNTNFTHLELFLIEHGYKVLDVQKILTAKAKSSQVPKYSEFLERATVYIFISTVLRGRPGLCQDTLYNRIVPRHSAISGLGPKYSRNWTF